MATDRLATEHKKADRSDKDERSDTDDRPEQHDEAPGGAHADSPVQDEQDRDVPTGTSGPSQGGTSLSPSPPREDSRTAIDETHEDEKKKDKAWHVEQGGS